MIKKKVFDRIVAILYLKNRDLISLFQNRFDDISLSRIYLERKDLKQELTIKLWMASRKFVLKYLIKKETDFVSVRSFLFISLRNHTLNLLRNIIKEQNVKKEVFDEIQYIRSTEKEYDVKIEFHSFYFNGVDVLSFLSPKERIIFRRYILGFKIREISKKFDVPLGSVVTIISRSKKKIRKQLRERNLI